MPEPGLQALSKLLPGQRRGIEAVLFDLILMDMQMPVMDGLAATRAIRDLEARAGCTPTPIAMFTANALDEHLVLAEQAGANPHFAKPITPERLLAGIELALDSAASEQTAETATHAAVSGAAPART